MDQSTIDIAERKKQFFQRIKTETADLHRQTEGSRLSVALMSENLTEKSYGDYLLRMKEIVAHYEKEIYDGLSDIIPDIDRRRKLAMIESDLAYFNIDTEKNKLVFALPPAASIPMRLGYMYVLEGSSLGGAMIYKQVSRKINISEQQGGAYFTCYQSELSSKWKSFLDILGDHGLKEENAQEIIRGARIAFQHICQHLS